MGILPAPNEGQFTLHFADTRERVVIFPKTKAARVNICGIQASCRGNLRLKRSAKREVASETNTHAAESPGAIRLLRQKFHECPYIGVIARKFLCVFQLIATGSALNVVCQCAPCRFKLVIHLRRSNNVPVPSHECCQSGDRPCNLIDFGEEQDGWIPTCRLGPEDMRAHWAIRRGEIDKFRIGECHGTKYSASGVGAPAKLENHAGLAQSTLE